MIQQILCNVQIYVLLLNICHEYILQSVIFILQGVLSTIEYIYDTDYSSKQLSQWAVAKKLVQLHEPELKHTHTSCDSYAKMGNNFKWGRNSMLLELAALLKRKRKKRRKQQMKAVQH